MSAPVCLPQRQVLRLLLLRYNIYCCFNLFVSLFCFCCLLWWCAHSCCSRALSTCKQPHHYCRAHKPHVNHVVALVRLIVLLHYAYSQAGCLALLQGGFAYARRSNGARSCVGYKNCATFGRARIQRSANKVWTTQVLTQKFSKVIKRRYFVDKNLFHRYLRCMPQRINARQCGGS